MNDLTRIRYLLTDVDDTLTTQGRLLPETLRALSDLQDAGIRTIAVTGACAGWCDQMIRLWPLDAVIGENGAFCFYKAEGRRITQRFFGSASQMKQQQVRLLDAVTARIRNIPGMQIADDQAYRLCDVAIDFAPPAEPPASPAAITALVNDLRSEGFAAQRSSIHINCWVGDYDKRTMAEQFLTHRYELSRTQIDQYCAYVGDAPNDEPMFAWLSRTFGVANIRDHLPDMTHRPATILPRPGGLGFADLVQQMLADASACQRH